MSKLSMASNHKTQKLFINLALLKNNELRIINEVNHCRSNQKCVLKIHLPNEELNTIVQIKTNHDNVSLKNSKSIVKSIDGNKYAFFPNLRFVGKSGRGKKIDLLICIQNKNNDVIKYENAIKVTVDGVRKPRNIKKRVAFSSSSSKSSITNDSRANSSIFTRSASVSKLSIASANHFQAQPNSLNNNRNNIQQKSNFSTEYIRQYFIYKQYAIDCMVNNLQLMNVDYMNNRDYYYNIIDSISSFIAERVLT